MTIMDRLIIKACDLNFCGNMMHVGNELLH